MFRKALCLAVMVLVLAILDSVEGAVGPLSSPDSERFEVPLVVRETAGIDRLGAPVRGGIPLPERANITSVDQLRLFAADGRTPVDCQFTVLSRWFGPPDDQTRPIRWVLLEFSADVPAHGVARFFLRRSAAPHRTSSPLSALDTADSLIVRTGALTARISKRRLSIFEEVLIDAAGSGRLRDRIVRPDPLNGIAVLRKDGSRYLSGRVGVDPPTRVEVERSGPLVLVVKVVGSIKPGTHNGAYLGQLEGIDYTLRFYFYARRSFVRVHLTIGYADKARVDGVAGQGAVVCHRFEELALHLATTLTGVLHYRLGGRPQVLTGTLSSGGQVLLYQDSSGGPNWGPAPGWPTRLPGYEVLVGGSVVARGRRAPGWLDLSGPISRDYPRPTAGVAVALRWFWQEFPKSLGAGADGVVKLGLFPGEWAEPFVLQGGRRKSHDILFYFHRGDARSARVERVVGDFLAPLRVCAPPQWYASSGALSPFSVVDDELFGPYERFVRTAVVSDDGRGTRQYEREINDNYGWLNYGDTFLAGTKTRRIWSNNALDLAYCFLLQSLRRERLAEQFFREGAALARHQMDIDTYATPLDDPWVCWGTRAPDQPTTPDHSAPPSLDATGIMGVILYYYLTGAPWAREAALKWRDWVMANAPVAPGRLTRLTDLRALAPIVDGLCEVYMLTGREADLNWTRNCIREMVLKRLSVEGYISSPRRGGRGGDVVSPPAMAEVSAALGRYCLLQRRRRAPDLLAERALQRILEFLYRRAWTRTPVRIGGRRYPAALATTYYPDSHTARYDRLAAHTAIDAFAAGYLLWGADQPTYLGLVRQMYEAAFDPPPEATYYRPRQSASAYEFAYLIHCGQMGMYLLQRSVPRIVWVPTGANLTKDSVGPYLVRVRLRNVPPQVVPQLDYALDNTTYAGWRDMRPVPDQPGLWELEVPDLGWRRLAAHRLTCRVRLLRPDRTVLGRPRYRTELIDSLDLPPSIYPPLADITVTAGGQLTVELTRHARDNEDPPEALTWAVANVNERIVSVRVDRRRNWLIVRPLVDHGIDTITLVLRDSAGNVARQDVKVTVVPAPPASPPEAGE